MSAAPKPKSDLPVRAASGLAMIVVAGLALSVGGIVFLALLALVSVIAIGELIRIARALPWSPSQRLSLMLIGTIYVAVAAAAFVLFRRIGIGHAIFPLLVTIATDIGAYFAGRGIGGPKIAPAISPSKTWAGLIGGMIAAGSMATIWSTVFPQHGKLVPGPAATFFFVGAALAVVAQIGDFAESFLKRRAGIKDSGTIIPGHGGVLDRIDGLLAVLVACLIGWSTLSVIVE